MFLNSSTLAACASKKQANPTKNDLSRDITFKICCFSMSHAKLYVYIFLHREKYSSTRKNQIYFECRAALIRKISCSSR